jgi:hypothetical protein
MTRFLCGLALALCLVPARAEETPAVDRTFARAMRQSKFSVREMLARLWVSVPLVDQKIGDVGYYFPEVYTEAVARSNEAEFEELADLLRALPPKSFTFRDCVQPYVVHAIHLAVMRLAERPVRLEWQPSGEAIPRELADAPASFREAWRLHRAVVAPYRALPFRDEAVDPRPRKIPPLAPDLRRVVGQPEPGAWRLLAAQGWGHTGDEHSREIYHPRNRALLLSLLADGKLHEAAGAALGQHAPIIESDTRPREPIAVELLPALGLDWEQVVFGSLLPLTMRNGENGRMIANSAGEFDAWRLLAARASERAVRQCLELIHWARLEPQNTVEFLLTALGPAPAMAGDDHRLGYPSLRRIVKLPPELRQELGSVLCEYLAPTNSPADLVDAMEPMPGYAYEELREPLTALLAHRAHRVAADARRLLTKAGMATGEVAIAPPTPPLAFRLVLNGQPLSGAPLTLRALRAGPEPNPKYVRPLVPARKLTTPADGAVQFPLAECAEPERLVAVELRHCPKDEEPEDWEPRPPPDPTRRKDLWPGPWIVQRVNVRAGNEQVHEVALHGADLEVRVSAFPGFPPGTPVALWLWRVVADKDAPEESGAEVETRAGSSGFFQRLQAGKYQLQVTAPWAAEYKSGEITIGEAAVVHEVKLEPGRSVRGTLVHPDGTKTSYLPAAARLFRDGVEIQQHYAVSWSGLPFGRYTARIPSTREEEEAAKKAGRSMPKIANEDRTAARELSFVIDASTPEPLDLGEVVVPGETP